MRNNNASEPARDFLAIALIGAGSSYARGPDLEDCVKRLGRGIVDDWSSIFDVAGKPCDVNLYEVPAGFDQVRWEHRGVFATPAGGGDEVALDRLELRKITLPAKRRR